MELTGWLEDPFELIREADIFALPSLEEGSGSLALLEAMQAGLAVVSSEIDGIPEDIIDGESGLLVPPGDIDALCLALHRLLLSKDLRRQLSSGAAEVFSRRFTAARFSSELGGLYEQLLLS